MLPALSMASPSGLFNAALVAGPPSPEESASPVPAKVLMFPSVPTLRMRLLLVSAMYRLPAASRTTAVGVSSKAPVAAPPSPPKPFHGVAGERAHDAAGGCHFANRVVVGVGDVKISGFVDRHAIRTVHPGLGGHVGVPEVAEIAGPRIGGDVAVGIHLANPAVGRIGNVHVAGAVKRDRGGKREIRRRRRPSVSRKSRRTHARYRADGEFRSLSETKGWAETHADQEHTREPATNHDVPQSSPRLSQDAARAVVQYSINRMLILGASISPMPVFEP